MAGKYFEILTEVSLCLSLSLLFLKFFAFIYVLWPVVIQAAARPCNIHCLWERMTQQNADKEEVEFLAFEF